MLLFPPTRYHFSCDSCYPACVVFLFGLHRSLTFSFFLCKLSHSSVMSLTAFTWGFAVMSVKDPTTVAKSYTHHFDTRIEASSSTNLLNTKKKNVFVHERMIRMAKYMDDDRDGKHCEPLLQTTRWQLRWRKSHYLRSATISAEKCHFISEMT